MIAHKVGDRPATPGLTGLQDGIPTTIPTPWLDHNKLY